MEFVDVIVDGRSKFLSRIFLLSIVTVVPLDGDVFSVMQVPRVKYEEAGGESLEDIQTT